MERYRKPRNIPVITGEVENLLRDEVCWNKADVRKNNFCKEAKISESEKIIKTGNYTSNCNLNMEPNASNQQHGDRESER